MPIRVLTVNFIDDIVERYPNLESVDLSHNCIQKIENLSPLSSLKMLDLSHNEITVLENLSCLPLLRSLDVSYNAINMIDPSIVTCCLLENLDLSHNLVVVFSTLNPLSNLQQLKTLVLEGNPISSLKDYRKQIARLLPQLELLDNRPIFLFERLDEHSDQIRPKEEFNGHQIYNKDERTPGLSRSSTRSSLFSGSNRRVLREELYHEPVRPEVSDLVKQIQLRDMQIASFEKVLHLQSSLEGSGTEALLSRWRKKVYEVLIQQESQILIASELRYQLRSQRTSFEDQIQSLRAQMGFIQESANRQILENELLTDRKTVVESALTEERSRSRHSENRIASLKDFIRQSKAIMRQKLLSFSEMFHSLISSTEELDAFSQRMKFALSRIKIYSDMIDKRNSRIVTSTSSSLCLHIPNSRMQIMEREIMQLSHERALLLCKVADFDKRIQTAVEAGSKFHMEQLQKAQKEHNDCLLSLEEVKTQRDSLQSKLDLRESEVEEAKLKIASQRNAFELERNSLVNINFRILTEISENFKQTLEKMSSYTEELRIESHDLKVLHESDAKHVRTLEEQLSKLQYDYEERLSMQASSLSLLLEKSFHHVHATEIENCSLKSALEQKDLEIAKLSSQLQKLKQKPSTREIDIQADVTEAVNVRSERAEHDPNGDEPNPANRDSPRTAKLQRLASLASSFL